MFKRDPLQIIVFKTSATATRLCVRGRALQDEQIDLESTGLFSLLLNSWKRFETDEVRNVTLNAYLPDGSQQEIATNRKGYFLTYISVETLIPYADEKGWVKLVLAYKHKPNKRHIQANNAFVGKVLLPAPKARFGIISDIDDTILHTGVISLFKWRVLYNTFFKAAGRRKPLNGIAKFYRLLHNGTAKTEANPVFYVSHSPWNLYLYIDYFLKKNNFPEGPIVLRNFPRPFQKQSKSGLPKKQEEIINLLQTHSTLKYILIGDSGERDPFIYLELAQQYPDRILAIYLQQVKHKKRMARVRALFKNYHDIPVLIVTNANQAIAHAKTHGFIV